MLPLLAGVLGLPLGGLAGRHAWEWFAERPDWVEFGSVFQGYDWVIGFPSIGA